MSADTSEVGACKEKDQGFYRRNESFQGIFAQTLQTAFGHDCLLVNFR